MSSQTVRVDRHDGWAIVSIAREDKRNAMDRQTRDALQAAFSQLRGTVRAIVLTGSGKSFCAGLDLKEREKDKASGTDTASQEWIDVNLSIRDHPAIFIAAVNGLALGGGATLISVCDLAVVSTEASIGCPELGFATYPAMAGPGLQLSLTRKRAAWLVLTTNRLSGAKAAEWGLVNEVVPHDQLLARASEIARQVAQFDADALAESKRALDAIPARHNEWAAAFEYGQKTNATIRSRTNAAAAGLANFATGKKNPGQGF
ncbi:enoyl-CoA hydratase/isomerase family protein [Chelativorans sp. AA-79]|uniref:enoyl-CoA hydratase/isomerase family protein n=1 Tax=Chelativorans sp. AA-79 TaxID=3028735 RepID=UPI0023F9618C|nr:enoyl-CoA hydratase/isomerase family protein [Chelativorans sp. AA-79]WEX12443.1 enoyl-CoA hydratase/isomerase family protein [Chelativorans sp. AA-79]